MSMTRLGTQADRDAAHLAVNAPSNVLGVAYVSDDGELLVTWSGGGTDVIDPQEREFSEGEPLPYHTFLLWLADEQRPTHVEIPAVSLSAAISALEGWLLDKPIDVERVTLISHNTRPADPLGRTPYIRTVGGYAPLAA